MTIEQARNRADEINGVIAQGHSPFETRKAWDEELTPERKNGTSQTSALTGTEIALLTQRRATTDSDYVFPGRGPKEHLVEPKEGWLRLLRNAGITNCTLHDLRRNLGSWIQQRPIMLVKWGCSVGESSGCGFADKTGKLVIKPKFDRVDAFSEGLAAVGIAGKYGFIDKTGNLVIKPQFDAVGRFSEDLAGAGVDDKYGFIDRTGKLIIKPKFVHASDFSEGLARMGEDGHYGYIDRTANL